MQPDQGRKLLKNPDFSTFPSEMSMNLAFFGRDTPGVFCLNYAENTIGTYCEPVGSTDTVWTSTDGIKRMGFLHPKP